jgi:hypothetical protein
MNSVKKWTLLSRNAVASVNSGRIVGTRTEVEAEARDAEAFSEWRVTRSEFPGNSTAYTHPGFVRTACKGDYGACHRLGTGVSHRQYSCVMRPLRYSINVTLDGCCDHRAMLADEDLHRHAVENLDQADAVLFGRVTYEMMEAAFRPPTRTGARPDWMEPFARTINAAKKYVVSSTLDRVDWNAELVRGDLGKAVQQLVRDCWREA